MTYLLADYDNCYDAIALLWQAYQRTDDANLRGRIVRAIGYLRERAYNSLPWAGDVLPNKGWDGKQAGGY